MVKTLQIYPLILNLKIHVLINGVKIKLNIGVFNNQGDVTFRQIIWSGQVSNSLVREIVSISTSTISSRKHTYIILTPLNPTFI